jgi:hypothetical protein
LHSSWLTPIPAFAFLQALTVFFNIPDCWFHGWSISYLSEFSRNTLKCYMHKSWTGLRQRASICFRNLPPSSACNVEEHSIKYSWK